MGIFIRAVLPAIAFAALCLASLWFLPWQTAPQEPSEEVAGSHAAILPEPVFLSRCRPVALSTPGASTVVLLAEFAETAAERSHGMMGRLDHPDGAAMLFAFKEGEAAVFWMKDTPLPLDIAFFDEGGLLVHLEIAAKPMSERLIAAPGNMRTPLVLELPAGTAGLHGLTPGWSRIEAGEPLPCPGRATPPAQPGTFADEEQELGKGFMQRLIATRPAEPRSHPRAPRSLTSEEMLPHGG